MQQKRYSEKSLLAREVQTNSEAAAVIERLNGLDLRYPEVSPEDRQALAKAREQLLAE